MRLLSAPTSPQGPPSFFLCRYVYDRVGGDHSAVIPELAASVATFVITTLWLGPCDIVYLWSVLNCFGLNFELWVQKLAEHGPLAQIEVGYKGPGPGDWLGSVGGSHEVGGTAASWSHPGMRGPWPRTFSLTSLVCQGHAPPRGKLGLPGLAALSALVAPLGLGDTD